MKSQNRILVVAQVNSILHLICFSGKKLHDFDLFVTSVLPIEHKQIQVRLVSSRFLNFIG